MSSSGYRGNYATAILAVVLLLEPRCHCVPINMPAEREGTAVREPWWHIPCDTSEELTTERQPARLGGQLKSLRRTQTQLKIAGIHYKRLALKEMYSEVVGVLEEAYNYDWLPEKQIDWFKKEFGKIEDFKKESPKVLIALHVALQRFAVTLDRLHRHHHSDTNHHQFNRKRTQILDGLCKELKKLLCEVEQSLSTAGEPPSPPLGEEIIPSERWDDRPDRTAMFVQDWGVLKYYERFLDDWTSIVDKLLKSALAEKKKQLKQRGHNRQNGREVRGQRPGSQENERSGEDKKEGVKAGRRQGGGRRRKGGNNGRGEKRRERRRGRGKSTKKPEEQQQQQQ